VEWGKEFVQGSRVAGAGCRHRMASVRRGLEYCSGSGGGCACCTCRTSPSILFALAQGPGAGRAQGPGFIVVGHGQWIRV
jgi:hypothetical protein